MNDRNLHDNFILCPPGRCPWLFPPGCPGCGPGRPPHGPGWGPGRPPHGPGWGPGRPPHGPGWGPGRPPGRW